jgi:hypothetical protein
MEIFIQTFESVAMLLAIGVLGFWILSRGIMPASALRFLGRLALEVALPCLIFVKIIEQFDPVEHPRWWVLPLWWMGFTVVAAVLTFLATRIAAREDRAEFGLTLFYQNATFFPLAIITQLWGSDSRHVVDLFFFVMFFGAFLFSTYRVFYERKLQLADWKKVLHPVFVITLVALTIRLLGGQRVIPEFLLSAVGMVGEMTVPLLMLILGGSIYLDFQESGKVRAGEVVKFVAIKNFAFPLVFLVLLLLIRPARHVALMVILQAAVPPVTSAPVLVDREDGKRPVASQFLVASFLASLVSLPLMVWLFGSYFGR